MMSLSSIGSSHDAASSVTRVYAVISHGLQAMEISVRTMGLAALSEHFERLVVHGWPRLIHAGGES